MERVDPDRLQSSPECGYRHLKLSVLYYEQCRFSSQTSTAVSASVVTSRPSDVNQHYARLVIGLARGF